MVCKVSTKKFTDVIPWLSPNVQRQLQHHKQTSTGFLKRSRQSRLNKVTEPKAGTCYIQGSVLAFVIAKKMRKAGEIVTAAKLFSRTHTKSKDKIFADDRAKAVWVYIKPLKCQPPCANFFDVHYLFLEAVGGWSEKGTVYRLGNSATLFYEKPMNHTTLKKSSYTPSIVSQLQTELDSIKTELNSIKNELQQQRTSMEQQRQRVEEQQRQLEQQQGMMEEQKHGMEKQQRMLGAQCKMMEDQKQALLGVQSQMALMSSLLGDPSPLHDSEK
ncbi:hypothetical protein Cgig2_014534 [Carnegiea gigantea]|uniref:Uncharacterized protein n=1 Tax=Carnegiea gigantea TaxID=171969 RepID=A0A9Q1JL70_9CARY|nr:hypothetical protein Cgig2_014534 [Carnegiea gigantea]